MPPQDGVGSRDREGLSPPGPDPGQPDPEKTIRRAKPGPGRRPLVHGELLTQGEVLDRKLAVAAAEEREQAKQVGQESDHRAGLCQDQIRQINDLPAGRGFGEGQHALYDAVHLILALGAFVNEANEIGMRLELAPLRERVDALKKKDS